MNIGRIITADCVNLPAPPDPRCSDPAFALANPSICPVEPFLLIKPAFALSCPLGSVQYRAYFVKGGVETDVTDSTIFTSSDDNIAVVGAVSGNATALSQGNAIITATYQSKTAQSEMTVIGTDTNCCDETEVAFMVLVDTSKSMGLSFSSSYATRLTYAKAAATRFISEINQSKDLVGLEKFNAASADVLAVPSADKTTVGGLVSGIGQTQQLTTFYDALQAGIDELDLTTAGVKVLVLISDGEDTTQSYLNGNNPIQLASDFKARGGIVICLGCRASGKGFGLLSALATGGFFINGYPDTQAQALNYLSGLKGYICAGNCTPEGDLVVAQGALNYDSFINWDVIGGTVDLQGNGFVDLLPGNGLYVDLAGTTPSQKGRLQLKTPISLVAGNNYRVSLELSGNQRENLTPDSARVRVFFLVNDVPQYLLDQAILINDFTQDFHFYNFTFSAPADVDAYISVQQEDQPVGGDARIGLLLNSVRFDNVTTLENLFFDNFDEENLTYVPPRCGAGLYGYYGYDCYGTGCLTTPPGVQLQDPNPLADIESGYTPPRTFTATKTACASCPAGSINVAPDDFIPAMTSNTTPSGIASASTAPGDAWKAFDGDDTTAWAKAGVHSGILGYKFTSAQTVTRYTIKMLSSVSYAAPRDWTLEGSNDNSTWTVLDTQSLVYWYNGEEKTFAVDNDTAFLYYRLNITSNSGGQDTQNLSIAKFALHGGAPASVCEESTATSEISQADADTQAYNAALALAQAQLNCQTVYTSTQQYTADCPVGSFGQSVTKSATATSLISQEDADAKALADAQTAALASLDCSLSNNTQKITINDGGATEAAPATPFPSVKYLSGLTGLITKVTCVLKGFTHTSCRDVSVMLRSPSGTMVELMRGAGGHIAASNVTLTFDDAAGAPISNVSAPTTGSYQVSLYNVQGPYPAPCPAPPYGSALSDFNGEDPNGSWSLWVMDVLALDVGQIANGFDLTITTA